MNGADTRRLLIADRPRALSEISYALAAPARRSVAGTDAAVAVALGAANLRLVRRGANGRVSV